MLSTSVASIWNCIQGLNNGQELTDMSSPIAHSSVPYTGGARTCLECAKEFPGEVRNCEPIELCRVTQGIRSVTAAWTDDC